ncbi:flagellar export protein FliJ [Myxococcota bacterium]|jgi:flagellar export protein FliJ|nr:flagellar export protein FliJ [Myxococcota bacterium]
MKKFAFRFAAVLRQREIVLDQKRAVLSEAERKRTMAEELLTQRRQALNGQLNGGPRPNQSFDANAELVRQRFIHSLRQEIRRREQQLELIMQEVEAARAAVQEAHQALRAIEMLEEKDREAWRFALKRAEEKQTDETNAQRWGR